MSLNKNVGYGAAMLNAVSQIIPTLGRIFVVFSPSDSALPAFQMWQEIANEDPLGKVRFYTSLSAAYDAVTTNNNDVILLNAYSNHALTSMLTVSKNRVHFIGMDGGGRKYGSRTKVSLGVTTAATDIAVVKNTGIGNSFRNIKFANDNTKTESLAVFAEGGEYAYFENCEFYRSTLLDTATGCELLMNGDSSQFVNCTFGSLADAVVGNVIHPCVRLANGQVGSGLVTRDAMFKECNFWRRTGTGGTTTVHVYAAADADVERMVEFRDCNFVNAKLGAATMAVAVGCAATLTQGYIYLTGNTSSCGAITKIGTATGIISGLNVKVATATIGLQAS
jgi:hypothetical protein